MIGATVEDRPERRPRDTRVIGGRWKRLSSDKERGLFSRGCCSDKSDRSDGQDKSDGSECDGLEV